MNVSGFIDGAGKVSHDAAPEVNGLKSALKKPSEHMHGDSVANLTDKTADRGLYPEGGKLKKVRLADMNDTVTYKKDTKDERGKLSRFHVSEQMKLKDGDTHSKTATEESKRLRAERRAAAKKARDRAAPEPLKPQPVTLPPYLQRVRQDGLNAQRDNIADTPNNFTTHPNTPVSLPQRLYQYHADAGGREAFKS